MIDCGVFANANDDDDDDDGDDDDDKKVLWNMSFMKVLWNMCFMKVSLVFNCVHIS